MKKLLLALALVLVTHGLMAQEAFTGEIRMIAGNYAPRNWNFCEGQLLPIAQHQALYSLLGTTYGGDGRTTFALPDLRGRVPVHAGQGPGLSRRTLGERNGTEINTLTINNLPTHNHQATVTNPVYADEATSDDPTGQYHAVSGENMYSNTTNAEGGTQTVTVENAGNGQGINNMQPYLGVNFIICLDGVYPPRN